MLLTILKLTIFSFIFINKTQGKYYVYTYDNGTSSDTEQCCLVRMGDEFCLAKPITRSLVQVRKECQRLNANEKTKNYWKNIRRRLNSEQFDKFDEKILIHLEQPLEKEILKNDLLCLSSTNNNNINLEKCFIEGTIYPPKSKKRKNATNQEQQPVIQRIEVNEPIHIRDGHGLSVRQTYVLNLTNFQATTRRQRQCWSWYRENTKNIFNYPRKTKKKCVSLNFQNEKCLKRLFFRKYPETYPLSYSIEKYSKLYCENNFQQIKLLGYNRFRDICFTTHYEISIEYKFTDYLSLSDIEKNQDILRYLLNNTKFIDEFQVDCQDKKTLTDLENAIEKEKQDEIDLSTQE